MPGPLDPYYNLISALTAQYGSTITMDIWRPAYNQAGDEDLIASGLSFRIDPAGASTQVQNPAPGAKYFVVAGAKEVLVPGDVLKPSTSDGSTPIVTVIQNLAMSDTTAMHTGIIGSIGDNTRDPFLYTKVYFTFCGGPRSGEPIIPEFEYSRHMETNRACLWNLKGDFQDQRLFYAGKRWLILATAEFDNQLLLQLRIDHL